MDRQKSIKYCFQNSNTYRTCQYKELTIQGIKRFIIGKEAKCKNITIYQLQIFSRDQPNHIIQNNDDLFRCLEISKDRLRIIAKRVEKKIQSKVQQVKKKGTNSEHIEVSSYEWLRQNPEKDEQRQDFKKEKLICCKCSKSFGQDEKVYIQIDNLDPLLILCGDCDKNQTSTKSYGIRYQEFLKDKLDSSIRCIFFLKRKTEPIFFQTNNIQELKKSKLKLQSMITIICQLQENLIPKRKQQIISKIKQLVRKNPKASKNQLLKIYNQSK